MPSNKDLINEIKIVAAEKGVDVPVTDGKSNIELVDILKGLKTPPPPGTDAEAKEKADAEAKEKADAEAKEKPAFEDSVAPGVSITACGARILAEGDEITKNDIPSESFEVFLKSGKIVKG